MDAMDKGQQVQPRLQGLRGQVPAQGTAKRLSAALLKTEFIKNRGVGQGSPFAAHPPDQDQGYFEKESLRRVSF